MKKFVMNDPSEIHISGADIEVANLNEWQRLELHLLDQAAVVIPGEMTVMEVVRTVESLQGLASDLLAAIGNACEIDPESGTIHVVEADYRYDLTDVSPTLLDTFRECGICLDDLETKLKEEAVVYGAEVNESFSD